MNNYFVIEDLYGGYWDDASKSFRGILFATKYKRPIGLYPLGPQSIPDHFIPKEAIEVSKGGYIKVTTIYGK